MEQEVPRPNLLFGPYANFPMAVNQGNQAWVTLQSIRRGEGANGDSISISLSNIVSLSIGRRGNHANTNFYPRNAPVKHQAFPEHKALSSHHLSIYRVDYDDMDTHPPLVYAEDHSHNGTMLNGRRMEKYKPVLLQDGDRLVLAWSVRVTLHQPSLRNLPTLARLRDLPSAKMGKYIISNRILGEGGYGRVFMCSTEDRKQFAVKIINKRTMKGFAPGDKRRNEHVKKEITILKDLQHHNILKLHDVFEEGDNFFIITDLLPAGDLFSYITQYGSSGLPENHALAIMYQLGLAIQYLHERGVVHRDLKIDNILLTSIAPGALVVVADFGVSRYFVRNTGERMHTIIGTRDYHAPELVSPGRKPDGFTEAVDVWGLGLIMAHLLTGRMPFSYPLEENLPVLRGCQKWLEEPQFLAVSRKGRSCISNLLQVDDRIRWTVSQMMSCAWIKDQEENLGKLYERALRRAGILTDTKGGDIADSLRRISIVKD